MCKACRAVDRLQAYELDKHGRLKHGNRWNSPKLLTNPDRFANDIAYVALCDLARMHMSHLNLGHVDENAALFFSALIGNCDSQDADSDATPVIGMYAMNTEVMNEPDVPDGWNFFLTRADGEFIHQGRVVDPEHISECQRMWSGFSPDARDAVRDVVNYAESVPWPALTEILGEAAESYESSYN